MEMDPNIKRFLEGLMAEAGTNQLPADEQKTMMDELYVRLEDRLVLAVMDALPEDKKTEFQGMLDGDEIESPEQVQEYIVKNLPGYEQVFVAAFASFREDYLRG